MTSAFPKDAAIAFVDVYAKPLPAPGSPLPSPAYKVIAYLPKYDQDLTSKTWTTAAGAIPFREVWSSTNPPVKLEKNGLTQFRGHLRHVGGFGKNPKTFPNTNEPTPRNPFEAKSPDGIHIQFAIVHYWGQTTPTGSLVGVASVYDEKTQHDPQEATILSIYRVKEIPVFTDRLDIECRVAYVAAPAGLPPTEKPQAKPAVQPSGAN